MEGGGTKAHCNAVASANGCGGREESLTNRGFLGWSSEFPGMEEGVLLSQVLQVNRNSQSQMIFGEIGGVCSL